MNAILGLLWEDAAFVEDMEYLMLITVRNAVNWRKIEMAAQRLSIWEVQELIYSMNGKSMVQGRVNNNTIL